MNREHNRGLCRVVRGFLFVTRLFATINLRTRHGNCLDIAVIENFFGVLKSELLYLQEFESMEHFRIELAEYLDYYNDRCSKEKLKGLPPVIHRLQALQAAFLSNFLGSVQQGD